MNCPSVYDLKGAVWFCVLFIQIHLYAYFSPEQLRTLPEHLKQNQLSDCRIQICTHFFVKLRCHKPPGASLWQVGIWFIIVLTCSLFLSLLVWYTVSTNGSTELITVICDMPLTQRR